MEEIWRLNWKKIGADCWLGDKWKKYGESIGKKIGAEVLLVDKWKKFAKICRT